MRINALLFLLVSGCAYLRTPPPPRIDSWDLVTGRGRVVVPLCDGCEKPPQLTISLAKKMVHEACRSTSQAYSRGEEEVAQYDPSDASSSVRALYQAFSCTLPLRARVSDSERRSLLASDELERVKSKVREPDPMGVHGIPWGAPHDAVEDHLDDAGLESKDEGAWLTTKEVIGDGAGTLRWAFQNGRLVFTEFITDPGSRVDFVIAARDEWGVPDAQSKRWDIYEFVTTRILIARDPNSEVSLRFESVAWHVIDWRTLYQEKERAGDSHASPPFLETF